MSSSITSAGVETRATRTSRRSMRGRSSADVRGVATRFAVPRSWPIWLAVVLAWPVGIAAAEPVVNGADLLLVGIGALFVWGVAR